MQQTDILDKINEKLDRIANALEASGPQKAHMDDPDWSAPAYLWEARTGTLRAVPKVNRVPLELLKGLHGLADPLMANTRQFAQGLGANNVLLWGARGMGKSSLVKAAHAAVNEELDESGNDAKPALALVEINREDLGSLPELLRLLAPIERRFILFCDDLSFDKDESSYKSLKTVLDGGVEGRPDNVVFYATSNRRHLMPRDMIENERSTAINPSEAVEEKVSLSDRFGLWLGFHNCSQETYLQMVTAYAEHYGIPVEDDDLKADAISWAQMRGARSGRVAIQFIRQLAGQHGIAID